MRAKGHDWRFSIKIDGREIKAIRYVNSIDMTFGLGVEVVNYVAQKAPTVTGINNEVTFACPFDVATKDYIDLLAAQQKKNESNETRANMRIDVSTSVDFGDGGRTRIMVPDCTLHEAGLSVSGRVESNTNSSPTFTAGTWKKLA